MRGDRYTTKNRLAQMLMQQESAAAPIRSHSQGLASALRQGLAGYMMGSSEKELAERQAADQAARAAVAQAYSQGIQSYDPSQRAVMTPPDGLGGPSPSRPVSPYSGIMENLRALPDSDYKSQALQELGMGNMQWKQQQEAQRQQTFEQNRLAAEQRAQQLADAERAFKRDVELESIKREGDLADKLAELRARDMLARGRSKDDALRVLNLERVELGLAPLSELPIPSTSVGSPITTSPSGAGQTQPQTMAEARAIAAANEAAAKEQAKLDVTAREELPQIEANAQEMLNVLDQVATFDEEGNVLRTHPGFSDLVGMPSGGGLTDMIPFVGGPVRGTNAADFQTLLDQIQGKTFLQAYQSLKGGGQITEIEGKKAEAAIARMNKAQSEETFLKSLKEFREVIQKGVDRARNRASQGGNMTSSMPPISGGNEDEWEVVQ